MSGLAQRKIWFERNEQAEALESEGKTLEALTLYEQNAGEGCDVAYTYERMAALYRLLKRYDEEIAALEKAVSIEEERGPNAQALRLKERLETSRQIRKREGPRGAVTAREAGTARTRPAKVKRKEKKGCLSVVLFLVTTAGLAASFVL